MNTRIALCGEMGSTYSPSGKFWIYSSTAATTLLKTIQNAMISGFQLNNLIEKKRYRYLRLIFDLGWFDDFGLFQSENIDKFGFNTICVYFQIWNIGIKKNACKLLFENPWFGVNPMKKKRKKIVRIQI